MPNETQYERNRRAKENLEKTIRDTGVSPEKAHRKAMEIAREADAKSAENKSKKNGEG